MENNHFFKRILIISIFLKQPCCFAASVTDIIMLPWRLPHPPKNTLSLSNYCPTHTRQKKADIHTGTYRHAFCSLQLLGSKRLNKMQFGQKHYNSRQRAHTQTNITQLYVHHKVKGWCIVIKADSLILANNLNWSQNEFMTMALFMTV